MKRLDARGPPYSDIDYELNVYQLDIDIKCCFVHVRIPTLYFIIIV